MPDPVQVAGPILVAGSTADAVIEALRAENPEIRLQVRGAYVRVESPGRCRVTRAAIEERLGRAFELPSDLEKVMPAFQGHFEVDAQQASWSTGPEAEDS
jgi:hypothetical protein